MYWPLKNISEANKNKKIMPSKSKAQQTAMCMALAARKGELEVSKLKGAALDIYKSDMTDKEIEDFTVLKEGMTSLKDYLTESRTNTREIIHYIESWSKQPFTSKEMYDLLGAITEGLKKGLEYRVDPKYIDEDDKEYNKASDVLKTFIDQLK